MQVTPFATAISEVVKAQLWKIVQRVGESPSSSSLPSRCLTTCPVPDIVTMSSNFEMTNRGVKARFEASRHPFDDDHPLTLRLCPALSSRSTSPPCWPQSTDASVRTDHLKNSRSKCFIYFFYLFASEAYKKYDATHLAILPLPMTVAKNKDDNDVLRERSMMSA